MAEPLSPAARSISHYEILAPLGHGGMGEVYVAFDTTLQRKVALKAVRRDRLDDEARARLLREARILSQLDHPGICRVYDYVSDGGSDYLVLELIEGKTLRDAMAPLDAGAKLRIAEQIAQALAVAHAAGIVHRDLKPDNVMLLPDGSAKVLDFGLARSFDAPLPPGAGSGVRMAPNVGSQFDSASETLPGATSGLADTGVQTVHGILLGTPAYMSPEQASGEPATAPSDMYAFGLLLQELFTGVSPYDLKTDLPTLLEQVRRGAAHEAVGVGRELGALIADLKSLAPSRRPTAVDAADRLRWIRNKPARRARYGIAAAIILVAIAGGIKYTVDLARERNAAVRAREEANARRAQAEGLIGFMLDDLRKQLESVGRLDLLDAVAAQATEYFGRVSPEALSDEEVSRRSQALYQLGDIQKAKGDLKGAAARFNQSLDLIALLARRDPNNPKWQLGLINSHFFVGDALRLQGDFAGAMRHFTAYRDIGDALAARDPKNAEWLLESSYGHSNVAAILEATGDLEGARRELTSCLEINRRVVALKPDAGSRDALAIVHNRLAVVLEKLGDATAALEQHLHSFEVRKALAAASPNNRVALRKLADAASWTGLLYRDNGDDARAMDYHRLRLTTVEQLVAFDPANADWQRELGIAESRMATVLRLRGDVAEAAIRARRATGILWPLSAKDPTHIRRQRDAADAAVELAAVHLAAGRAAAAQSEASRASSALEGLLAKGSTDLEVRRLLAEAYLAAAAAATRQGQRADAQGFTDQARAALEPHAATVKERRFQKAWAQALRGLGRTQEADAVIARLRGTGFRPFTP